MNQILSVEDISDKVKKRRQRMNSGPAEINNVVRFFAIAILVFGIFIIGSACYGMYKESQKEEIPIKPVMNVSQPTEKEVSLKVEHNKELSSITYSWNDEEATQVPCQGQKQVETSIEIPTGTNTLTIRAVDVAGQETSFQRNYTREGEININIEADGANIKVTADGKKQLSYMTYRWDEEEETKIDINSTSTEQVIEIPKGLHTLTVIVVDENNTTETKTQEVNGVTKPELEISTDGADNFIIKASDEQGIKKVEFVINEEETYLLNLEEVYELEERKQFEYAYPLHDGRNRLDVTVYNESDVTETKSVVVNK